MSVQEDSRPTGWRCSLEKAEVSGFNSSGLALTYVLSRWPVHFAHAQTLPSERRTEHRHCDVGLGVVFSTRLGLDVIQEPGVIVAEAGGVDLAPLANAAPSG